jgi:hypothetical protein
MRVALILLAMCVTTNALAQTPPPKLGNKPVAQVKPKQPSGCKFVGAVRGTKLWAGDCIGVELLKGTTDTSEQATSVIPPPSKQ